MSEYLPPLSDENYVNPKAESDKGDGLDPTFDLARVAMSIPANGAPTETIFYSVYEQDSEDTAMMWRDRRNGDFTES